MRYFSLLVATTLSCAPVDPLGTYCQPDAPCALNSESQPTQDTSRACRVGKTVCEDGVAVACPGFVGRCPDTQPPGLETCNGRDDNDNGEVDEGLATAFYYPEDLYPGTLGQGRCSPGYHLCRDGSVLDFPPQTPAPEVCGNQVDDDCDGSVDEATTPSALAIHFVVDFSGSMTPFLEDIVYQSCLATESLEADYPGSQFALTAYGTEGGESFTEAVVPFTDARLFCNAMQSGDNHPDAEEYPLDACLVADDLPWPPDALRYLALFSDEPVKSPYPLPEVYAEVRGACRADGYKVVVFATGMTMADFVPITDSCGGISPMMLELYFGSALEQVLRPDCATPSE